MSTKYGTFLASQSVEDNVNLKNHTVVALNINDENNNSVMVTENYVQTVSNENLTDEVSIDLFHDLQLYYFSTIVEPTSFGIIRQTRGGKSC